MDSLLSPSQPILPWLQIHPFWWWVLSHPLWAIALLGFILLLGSGLFRAIARLLEQLWLGLFRAPLALGQWGLNLVFRRSGDRVKVPSRLTAQAKLQDLITRWEQLQANQAALLEEFKQVLASAPREGGDDASR